jgi:outer membrane protein OmpA-like peptidoglycan-associated protein
MKKSACVFNLLAGLLVVMGAAQIAFPQEDVGEIKTIRGEVYWKQKADDPEVKLDPKQEGRKLIVGERFRCAKGSTLVLLLYGEETTIDDQMGSFPIPNVPAAERSIKTRTEKKSGRTAGGTASIPDGERLKDFRGIVVKRDPDSFTMSDTMGGPQTVVLLTTATEVKSHKRGVFRGSKEYGASYILRGLRLEVDGVGNSEGQLVAEKIRFDEQDLRAAQALKSTVDPIEAEMTEKLRQQQQEQERLAGQIEETQAVAAGAQAMANAAVDAARKAQATADYANNRINGLDDFDPIKTMTVYFKTGSAVLTPQAKAAIDESAAWVKTQNTKGWVMAVVGYADTTGSSARNVDLSERRANAVIYYIVTKYKIPLSRLVQPFGYGQLEPVAENTTKAGRAKNRRVEIRLMINKGIAGSKP